MILNLIKKGTASIVLYPYHFEEDIVKFVKNVLRYSTIIANGWGNV